MQAIDGRKVEHIVTDTHIHSGGKFKILWEYYYPRLLVYTGSFKGLSGFEPKDLVSDILIRVYNNLHKYNRLYSLSTWVYNIARNYLIDVYRKNKTNIRAVSIDEIDEQEIIDRTEHDNIVDRIIKKDDIEKCRVCIKSLNKKDQRIIFLKYYEGLNSKEIALIEGISHNTVRQRLMTIRSHIRKLLGEDHGN
jgi:RNA polymerase sigma-70 factor (ECF subfamily)